MRYSEINKFNQTLTNIWIEGGFNEAYSYGQEWDAVPFPSIKKVGIKTCETFTRGSNKIEKAYSIVETIPSSAMPSVFEEIFGLEDISHEWDVYLRALPEKATWEDIFRNLDQLVGDTGDTDHRFPEQMTVKGDTLFVCLGS